MARTRPQTARQRPYGPQDFMNWLDPKAYADPSAERFLLATVLSTGRIPPALQEVRPRAFNDDRHAELWEVILALHQADPDAAIDRARLYLHFKTDAPEPDPPNFEMHETLLYAYTLSEERPNPKLVPHHLRRLLNAHHKRQLWSMAMHFLKFLSENATNAVTAHSLRSHLRSTLESLDFGTPYTRPPTWADLQSLAGPVEWDWPGWLPRGALVLLAGESGTGKSLLALRLAASYLRGDPWPDACLVTRETGKQLLEGTLAEGSQLTAGEPTEKGGLQERARPAQDEPAAVLWCESEAAQLLNLQRARAWGLPCKRIWAPLRGTQDVQLHLPAHRAAISRLAARSEVRLVVVDSLSAAASGAGGTDQSARAVQWLAELARDVHKPILLLHHLRKRHSSTHLGVARTVRLEDLRGHSSIVQPARVVLALDAPDPARPHLKRLSVLKSNLAACPPPLGLLIEPDPTGAAPQIRFCDPPQPPQATSILEQAVQLLRELLAQGPLPAALIYRELVQAGISKRTTRRAKAQLGVRLSRQDDHWVWLLPSDAAEPPLLEEPAPE